MKPVQPYLDLTIPNTLFIIAIFAIFWYSWTYVKSRSTNSNLPPGPRGLPFVGNLLSVDPQLHTYFTKLAQTYGPIFKLKLGKKLAIVISSPSLAREVFKDHDITFANRDVTVAARLLTYGGIDIAWTPYGPQWRMLRKICVVKMLSNTTLDSLYELRRYEIRQTVSYIHSRAGTPINFGEQMFVTILNVIINMLWGGSVKAGEKARIGAEFKSVISDATDLLGLPNVSDFYPGLAWFDLQGVGKKMKALAGKIDRIFEDAINRNSKLDGESRKESKDFLQLLLKMKDDKDSNTPLTMSDIKAMLMDLFVGGSDTSSNSIEFTMAELINNPRVMKKVQEELDVVVGQGNIVEEAHIHKLSYLDAVVKESLRLHPTLPLLVPHCPRESCIVGGYTVPKGSRVFINAGEIHRDPKIWEKPLEFIPERFLKAEFDYNGNNMNYMPFGSGRRICIGIALAERMMLFALATMLHSFDWDLPQGQKLDISEKFGIVLKLKNPLVAIATPRLHDTFQYE